MDLYNAQALADKVGATYRQIEYWTTKGYLRTLPVHGAKTEGSGRRRVYGADEVNVARAIVAAYDLASTAYMARDAVENGKSVTLAGVDGEPIIRITVEVVPPETGDES